MRWNVLSQANDQELKRNFVSLQKPFRKMTRHILRIQKVISLCSALVMPMVMQITLSDIIFLFTHQSIVKSNQMLGT